MYFRIFSGRSSSFFIAILPRPGPARAIEVTRLSRLHQQKKTFVEEMINCPMCAMCASKNAPSPEERMGNLEKPDAFLKAQLHASRVLSLSQEAQRVEQIYGYYS